MREQAETVTRRARLDEQKSLAENVKLKDSLRTANEQLATTKSERDDFLAKVDNLTRKLSDESKLRLQAEAGALRARKADAKALAELASLSAELKALHQAAENAQ